jgi:hypothetical protein
MRLLDELRRKQQEARLTNKEMAAKLEMHHITWVNKKNEKYPLSPRDREVVIRIYPDLAGIFLAENAKKVSKGAKYHRS